MPENTGPSSSVETASAVPSAGRRSTGRWRRRWPVAVVVGAALVAGGVYYEVDEHDGFAQLYADVFHGGVQGPDGSLPPSPAARPSLRSLRATATNGADAVDPLGAVSQPPAIYRGISISLSATRDGVVNAMDLRSGKTYWRYQRHHRSISSFALDKKRGELFLSWGPPWPGDQKTSIEMMDVRSGRVHWRRSAGLAPVWSAHGPKSHFTRMAVDDAGHVVVLGDHGMAGLDGGTGRVRWTTLWPSGCSSEDAVFGDNPVVVFGTAAFGLECQATAPAVGYDTATGSLRWRSNLVKLLTKNPANERLSPGDPTHFSDLGGGLLAIWTERVTVVTDPASGRIVRDVGTDDWEDDAPPAGGAIVGGCHLPGRVSQLCAKDLRTGRSLWHTQLPLDRTHGEYAEFSAAIDNGRVYTLFKSANGSWQISVFDLHTGTLVEQAPMPKVPTSLKSTPQSYTLVRATDGVLSVRIHAAPLATGDGRTFNLVA